jgi:long-chain acyl-CoA synthetase
MKLNNCKNHLEHFSLQFKKSKPDDIFLKSLKNENKNYTWKETFDSVQIISSLISKHIEEKDRCLLISENRPEWLISDLSVMLSKGVTVPAYTTYVERDYEYLINDCKPSLLIISNNIQYQKIKNLIKKNTFIKLVISFDKIEDDTNSILNINEILNNKNYEEKKLDQLDIKRSDLACIIYTSGTQGNPKGVMLSHGGILNNCEGSISLLKNIISEKPKFLTWLPLSHSYEHTVQFVQIGIGAQVFYAESIDKLIKNITECKPDIMTAVPRFYQNLYQKINTNFNKTKGLKKYLITKMLELGKKKLLNEKFSYIENLQNLVCEKLVRKKIKEQFGGSLKAFISGGGALDKEVGIFLNSIGLPTLQGYGLTETSPVVSCNPISDIRIETVGPPFEGNQVKIADDGEILIKGENVMLGYWNNVEETEKVLKNEWLHSGDIGHLENGYLKITDRKKDIIITTGGDNISPVKIENELIKIKFIDQSLVFGDSKPYLVALIVLNKESKKISKDEIYREIEKINKNLSKIEKIKKFIIVEEQFTIENGLMTPTLKLKRFKIINKFKKQLEKLY